MGTVTDVWRLSTPEIPVSWRLGRGMATIAVEASATECKVAGAEAPSGTLSFAVRTEGDVTEFCLLAEDASA